MLTGCLRPSEAYRAIDLSLVFILAGSLGLGLALNKTGITLILADWLSGVSAATGPYLMLAGFFLLAVIISELMSNSRWRRVEAAKMNSRLLTNQRGSTLFRDSSSIQSLNE